MCHQEGTSFFSSFYARIGEKAIAGFTVNQGKLNEALDKNPNLVTAINSIIGYEQGAAIAKQAYKEGRAILEVAMETTGMSEKELRKLLDPAVLAKGGIHGAGGGGG